MNDSMNILPVISTQEKETAEWLAQSDLVPKDYKGKAANIIAAAIHGNSLGLDIMQSMQSIALINGRPSIYGDAALAIVMNHSSFEDISEKIEGEGDDRKAVCIVKRKNMTERVVEYSVARAKQAGLWGKSGPWTTDPERMLQMRARSFALRDTFADALKGFELREVAQDFDKIRDVAGEVIPKTEEKTEAPAAAVSRSEALAQQFQASERTTEDKTAEIEAQSASEIDEKRLHAMIENIKDAKSLDELKELQEPATILKRKLLPQEKSKLTAEFNQRSSELVAEKPSAGA